MKIGTNNKIFATAICRNCDGRFSCKSFRKYVKSSTKQQLQKYTKFMTSSLEDNGEWIDENYTDTDKEIE